MPLSDNEIAHRLRTIRAVFDGSREALDGAIARFGICNCPVGQVVSMRHDPQFPFCQGCGKRLEVPENDQ